MGDGEQPRSRPMRGLLLFVLGALVGANATYFVMTRDPAGTQPAVAMQGTDTAPANVGASPEPVHDAATRVPTPTDAILPPPVVSMRGAPVESTAGTAPLPTPASDALLIPVQGIPASQLSDTFTDARGNGRVHDAIDIMAPAGTPVLAVADGHVEKLFDSKLGGLTIYQFNRDDTLAYYYAHLQRYADGIAEGQAIRKGQLIGYVGATGNASPDAPHLHFAIFVLGPEKQWWKGEAINPYPRLVGTRATP